MALELNLKRKISDRRLYKLNKESDIIPQVGLDSVIHVLFYVELILTGNSRISKGAQHERRMKISRYLQS